MRLLLVLLMAVALASLSACATTPPTDEEWMDVYGAWDQQVRASLRRQDGTASRIAEAVLLPWPVESVVRINPSAVAGVHEAAAQSPNDRAIAALLVLTCFAAEGCDAAAAGAALRRIDPDNGIGHLAAVAAAVASDNAKSIDDAILTLATATRFEAYQSPIVVAAAGALATSGASLVPGRRRTSKAASDWIGVALGGFPSLDMTLMRPLTAACSGPASPEPRRRDCVKILGILLRSDTGILQSFASAVTLRLATADSPEATEARTWRRNADWQSTQLQTLFTPSRVKKYSREYLRAMRVHSREEDVRRAVLVAFDLPPDPPADWTAPPR